MKKYYFLFITSILMSCDQPTAVTRSTVDQRPKSELELIKKFNMADSTYNSQDNDISKKDVLDSCKTKISNFIIQELNSKIENWPAIIETIEVSEWPTKTINVKLVIPKGENFDKELPEFQSIVLSSAIGFDNQKLKDLFKTLTPFDKVLVTGTFQKDVINNIDFDAINSNEADTFNSPNFDFNILDIKRAK